jgi:hypothetical protein
MLAALSTSAVVAIFFGSYPAMQACALDPSTADGVAGRFAFNLVSAVSMPRFLE